MAFLNLRKFKQLFQSLPPTPNNGFQYRLAVPKIEAANLGGSVQRFQNKFRQNVLLQQDSAGIHCGRILSLAE